MGLFNELETGLMELQQHARNEKKLKTKKVEIKDIPNFTKNEIKDIRIKSGYTQRNFSTVLGVSPKTVEAWEKGTNKPSGSSRRLLQMMLEKPELIAKELEMEEMSIH